MSESQPETQPTDEVMDATVAAYDLDHTGWAAQTPTVRSHLVDDLISLIDPGSEVLELGSGRGLDALELERAGLIVHRTDGAVAFVDALRDQGFPARVLDVRASSFGGPFDAIFANAVLLHVPRDRLVAVLATALRATHPGGVFAFTLKKGDGDAWSTAKTSQPRHFTYWSEDDIADALIESGWTIERVYDSTHPSVREQWITAIARRPAESQ